MIGVPVGGVTIEPVQGEPPAEELAVVHRAAATVAYAHIFTTPFPLEEARRRWAAAGRQVWLARRGPELVAFAAATGGTSTRCT